MQYVSKWRCSELWPTLSQDEFSVWIIDQSDSLKQNYLKRTSKCLNPAVPDTHCCRTAPMSSWRRWGLVNFLCTAAPWISSMNLKQHHDYSTLKSVILWIQLLSKHFLGLQITIIYIINYKDDVSKCLVLSTTEIDTGNCHKRGKETSK